MSRVRGFVKDILKAFLIGASAAVAAAAILFLAGLVGGGTGAAGLETAKNGVFIATALLLFFLAGMLLIKGKKTEPLKEDGALKHHFEVIGLKTVTGIIALAFLLTGALADFIQRSL